MEAADIVVIQQVALRFSTGVTLCDTAMIASCFAEDGIMTNMSALLGRDDVEIAGPANIKALFDSFLPHLDMVQQMAQTLVTEIDGDKAQAQTMIREILRVPGGETTFFMAIYQDELVRTGDGWRFSRRTTQPTATFVPQGELTVL